MPSEISETKFEPAHSSPDHGITPVEAKSEISAQVAYFGQRLKSLLILLCFEDALHLCSMKSVIQVSYLMLFLFQVQYICKFF